jgi:RimJ/RimL family protein N-acetyltransferase
MTPPVLRGERVLLRPARASDARDRRAHGWDAEVERGYGRSITSRPMTDEEAATWLAEVTDAQADGFRWIVDVDGTAVGETALLRVDLEKELNATYVVGMFGSAVLGQGIGRDVTRTVLAHGFTTLGLHRIDLRVLEFNARAIASYRACGFVEEGRERESCRLDGRWYDDVMMSILDHEFAAAVADGARRT